MRKLGTIKTRDAPRNRTANRDNSECETSGYRWKYTQRTPESPGREAAPVAATPNSIQPYSAIGRQTRSVFWLSQMLPAASPPMKTASTVALAYTVYPKSSPSDLVQATS